MDREEFLKSLMRIGKIDSSEIEEYEDYLNIKFEITEKTDDGIRWVKIKGKNLEVSKGIYGGKEFYRILIRV